MPNLVGIGLSQVPTNSMLGGLAYQDPEHASIKDLDLKNLSQINSEIANNAVDIFIYDTSKDSDGGAWRKRTTHTSWYNETLGTAVRGTRKEFPSVAVIVVTAATTRKLYIYDGDDPDLPMWMVIDSSDGQWPQAEFSSLYALNGIIALGSASDTQPLYQTRNRLDLYYFVSDKIESSGAGTGGNYYGTVEGLVNRRTHATNRGTPLGNSVYNLVHQSVTDVAMHVQPNARVDIATGLPIPTIATGGDDHLTLINDDGTTADYDGFNPTQLIEICSGSVFGTAVPGNGHNYIYKTDTKTSDGTYNVDIVAGGTNYYMDTANSIPKLRYTGIDDFVIDSVEKTAYRASSAGIDIIREGPTINSSHALLPVAYVASDYNTGYMIGDIKGAFLSDTDTTDATYTTVADDWATTGSWTKQSSITISSTGSGTSGTLSITGNGTGSNVYFFNGISVEANTDYVVFVTFGAENANEFYINNTTYSNANKLLDINALSGLTRSGYFNSGSNTTLYIQGYQVSSSATTITRLVVQKVSERDRSVNSKDLEVFGTVTKSAVATGAEVVAYSGWSDSNFLRQPYNTGLNLGTGNLTIMGWFKMPDISQTGFLIDRASLTTSGGGPRFAVYAESSQLKWYTFNGASNTEESTSIAGFNNQWVCFVCTRHSTGIMEMYINGVLKDSRTGTSRDISNTASATTVIGHRFNADNGAQSSNIFEGSLALLRITASIPSAAQVEKIYEDEKMLFQENAKATLYGSSDAVTALAYDEVTKRLHAGTSAGRSDFQGLCRINNTTTAVTTAISAHDGFIVEQ